MTLNTTYGVQNVICANTTVVNPWEIPKLTNSRNKEIPVMISGFNIGMLLTKLTALRALAFKLKIPIAATLPNKVDTVAAIMAIANVFQRALTNECCTLPAKRELYNFVENPVQLPSTFASVNEKIMIIRIGE